MYTRNPIAVDSFGCGISANFFYDSLDRRTNVVYAAGNSVSYWYDNVGRVTNVVDAVSGSVGLSYDRQGRQGQRFTIYRRRERHDRRARRGTA